MIDIIYIVTGLLLLFIGGESLLKGSVSLARSYGISKIFVSAIIIGFGTSMPEMIVSVGAVLKESSDIALGNVIGSNIANILLIIGVSALLRPILIKDKSINRDIFWMLISSVLLIIFMIMDMLNFYSGIFLFSVIITYIVSSCILDMKNRNLVHEHIEEDVEPKKLYKPIVSLLISIFGLLTLIFGANLLVDGASSIARQIGISEAVIGLTIVAIGTSLPELATAIIASFKKHSDVVVGNVLGSCVFNMLAIPGVTFMIRPVAVPQNMLQLDVWVMLVSCTLFGLLLMKKVKIGKGMGGFMLSSYLLYTLWLYSELI